MKDLELYKQFDQYKSNDDLLSKVRDMMKLVPHGNSDYQDINFAISDNSPQGVLKHSLLNLEDKLNALDENILNRKEKSLELLEAEEELAQEKSKWIKKKITILKLQTRIERLKLELSQKEHLWRDCVRKIELFYAMAETSIKKIEAVGETPGLDNFEKVQHASWVKRLKSEAFAEFKGTGVIGRGHMEIMHKIGITADMDKYSGSIQFRELTDQETLFLSSPEVVSKEKYLALVNQKQLESKLLSNNVGKNNGKA